MPCSYRGYGLSKGTPSEAGLKQDAQAALDWLLHRQRSRAKVSSQSATCADGHMNAWHVRCCYLQASSSCTCDG